MPTRPRGKSGSNDARKRVGDNIRRLREACELTREELIARMGINRRESRDMTRKDLVELAARRYLDLDHNRAARGLTQKELAARVGTHEARISELEKGKHAARVDTLHRLALALGVDVSELFLAL